MLVFIKKNNIPFQDKERPAKKKFMPVKLGAVLGGAESDSTVC